MTDPANVAAPAADPSFETNVWLGLLAHLRQYAAVFRKSTQPFTFEVVTRAFPGYTPQFDDLVVRETLLEHVGCLPVVATYLHPHLDRPVDLGRVLTMAAVHDVGELATGDALTFTKPAGAGAVEEHAARSLLHPRYHALYDELQRGETNDAKFFASVDKLAPDLYDFLCGEAYTVARLHQQAGWPEHDVLQRVRDHKRPYMLWSPFLTRLHDALFARFSSPTRPVGPPLPVEGRAPR